MQELSSHSAYTTYYSYSSKFPVCQSAQQCHDATQKSKVIYTLSAKQVLVLFAEQGSRDSSVVTVSDLWLKGPGFNSPHEWQENFLLRVNFLCWLLVWFPPPHPHPPTRPITTVARKRSESFCQKCRWQVTAKHTCTLPMWLWVNWHCMVYTELVLRGQQFAQNTHP